MEDFNGKKNVKGELKSCTSSSPFLCYDIKISQKFYNNLIHASIWHIDHIAEAVQAVEGNHCGISIMVVGVLTCYALLHSMCNLKAAQMNVQCSLIQELMLYELKRGHNAIEANKNICCAKGENTVIHSIIS